MKITERFAGIFCCMILAVSLAACGGSYHETTTSPISPESVPLTEETSGDETMEEETTYDDSVLEAEGTVFEPVSGRLGEDVSGTSDGCVFNVSFVGAEFFRADDGAEAVRIYYDVKSNTTGDWIINGYDVNILAVQDGETLWNDLGRAYSTEAHLSRSDMRPGTTARFVAEYNCDWHGGPIYVEAYYFMTLGDHYLNAILYPEEGADPVVIEPGLYDDSLIAVFDPADMPCRPAVEDPRVAVTEPDLGGLPEEADLRYSSPGHIKINDAEFVDGEEGYKLIRINATYTNLSGAPESFSGAGYEIRVMQDNLGLWQEGDPYEVDYESAEYTQVDDGASIDVSFEYCIFSDSPVTVEFCDWADSDAKCGKVFRVE